MKNLTTQKVIFLTIMMFFSTQSMASDRLLPEQKPTVDKEIEKIVSKKKEIYPKKKPKLKENIINENDNQIVENKTEQDNQLETVSDVAIIPKKKPILQKLFYINFL